MSRYHSSHRRRDGHSVERSRSPPKRGCDQSPTVTVNLDGVAAEVLADDDEEFKRLTDLYSVHVKREMEGFNLKISFTGPARNVHDIMMALHRYLRNKNIHCPR